MRIIDDMIDNHKAINKSISPGERKKFIANVDDWLKMIIISKECNPNHGELSETIEKFRIPLWPLEDFAKSMIYDINHDGFPTIKAFFDYANGASIAPASIFVHLNGLAREKGKYVNPPFDVKKTATPCAIFSYIVHIIRDFQTDQLNNLNYFADDLINSNGLTRDSLRKFAEEKPVDDNFRNLINHYYLIADKYRLETYDMIKQISPLLELRYQLSLEIIFTLYLMVFERIDFKNGNFTTAELNPTAEEIKERVYNTIVNFKFN